MCLPIGSKYAIYGNMDPINIPPMLAYHTWILWLGDFDENGDFSHGIRRYEYIFRLQKLEEISPVQRAGFFLTNSSFWEMSHSVTVSHPIQAKDWYRVGGFWYQMWLKKLFKLEGFVWAEWLVPVLGGSSHES